MIREIIRELKSHAPFTAMGTVSGILIIVFISAANVPRGVSETLFWTLHPVHVFLSALVTTAIYKLHTCPRVGIRCLTGKCNLWVLIVIGYIGSVGIATLSDSLIPYAAEFLLDMPRKGIHLGFIEKWWLVNPLALLGIAVGCVWPRTRFPHFGHVFLSTWASVFHIAMAMSSPLTWLTALVIALFLFLAVWIPCCVSDIVFPLLFVNKPKKEGGMPNERITAKSS
ncbi:MAG: hypothetical protein PHP98_06435 [Kiritimatiellae bacterium]|nr:hypothetical protein [Kiritimatiellia bacterium]